MGGREGERCAAKTMVPEYIGLSAVAAALGKGAPPQVGAGDLGAGLAWAHWQQESPTKVGGKEQGNGKWWW